MVAGTEAPTFLLAFCFACLVLFSSQDLMSAKSSFSVHVCRFGGERSSMLPYSLSPRTICALLSPGTLVLDVWIDCRVLLPKDVLRQ